MRLYLISLFFFLPIILFSQVLGGILINNNTNQTIANASIRIINGDSDTTTDDGEYSLDLSKGGTYEIKNGILSSSYIDVFIKHEIYGIHERKIQIPPNLQFNITIEPNDYINLSGTVRDLNTGNPLEGIEVTIVPERNIFENKGNNIVAITDKSGGYKFTVRRSIVGNQNYIIHKFQDPKNQYEFTEKKLGQRHQSVSLVNKDVNSLNQYLEEIKVKLTSDFRPIMFIEVPHELQKCKFYYSFDNIAFERYLDNGIKLSQEKCKIYIKVVSSINKELGIIEREADFIEQEKRRLNRYFPNSNTYINCSTRGCEVKRSFLNSLNASKIGFSRFKDKTEYSIDVNEYKYSDRDVMAAENDLCLDPIKSMFKILKEEF